MLAALHCTRWLASEGLLLGSRALLCHGWKQPQWHPIQCESSLRRESGRAASTSAGAGAFTSDPPTPLTSLLDFASPASLTARDESMGELAGSRTLLPHVWQQPQLQQASSEWRESSRAASTSASASAAFTTDPPVPSVRDFTNRASLAVKDDVLGELAAYKDMVREPALPTASPPLTDRGSEVSSVSQVCPNVSCLHCCMSS